MLALLPSVGRDRGQGRGGTGWRYAYPVPRGGPVKRSRTVSTRVTPEEWARWDQRRERSGRRELGAWVRAVVNDAAGLTRNGRQPGDVPTVPEVNADAHRQLAGAAANVNQLARAANSGAQLDPETVARVLGELEAAARAVRGIGGAG